MEYNENRSEENKPGVVMHACHLNTREAESGGF
jgi:hypothetical protein